LPDWRKSCLRWSAPRSSRLRSKKNFGGAAARILVYILAAVFQYWNGRTHHVPTAEIPVLALLTALAATGIYHLAKKRWPA
jgi:hypothetical protein